MTKVIQISTGHPVAVTAIEASEIPTVTTANLQSQAEFTTFYKANVPTMSGNSWVIGKGHKQAPKQYVVWYPNGRMWSGFGLTFKEALDGAIENSWFYV